MAVTNIKELRELAGTEVKINVSLPPMGDVTMDNYDFECMFYPYVNKTEYKKKCVVLGKGDMLRIDESNYVAIVDTTALGAGEIMIQVTRYVPDLDCLDDLRTEIACVSTGIIMY